MGYTVKTNALNYSIHEKKILQNLSFDLQPNSFTVLLGENGSGKSTLLDLLMGFRKPKSGEILLEGKSPHLDDLELKRHTIFLSEKMEVPVYWKVGDYLDFNKHFFPSYSDDAEDRYLREYGLKREASFRSMSAGENKRAQIIAALASQPKLLMVDEITAVLDIVGRRKFMLHLKELQKNGATVLMATNILEDLEHYATDLILLNHGRLSYFGTMEMFIGQKPGTLFSEKICSKLEAA